MLSTNIPWGAKKLARDSRTYGSFLDPIFVWELKKGFMNHWFRSFFWIFVGLSIGGGWTASPLSCCRSLLMRSAFLPEVFKPLSCSSNFRPAIFVFFRTSSWSAADALVFNNCPVAWELELELELLLELLLELELLFELLELLELLLFDLMCGRIGGWLFNAWLFTGITASGWPISEIRIRCWGESCLITFTAIDDVMLNFRRRNQSGVRWLYVIMLQSRKKSFQSDDTSGWLLRTLPWIGCHFSWILFVERGTHVHHPLPNGESDDMWSNATQPVPFRNATASTFESRLVAQYAFMAPVSQIIFWFLPILPCSPKVKGLLRCLCRSKIGTALY